MPQTLLDTLAHAAGNLRVTQAVAGYDASLIGRAAKARGGVSLHVARDDAQASSFVAALAFFAGDQRDAAVDADPFDKAQAG